MSPEFTGFAFVTLGLFLIGLSRILPAALPKINMNTRVAPSGYLLNARR